MSLLQPGGQGCFTLQIKRPTGHRILFIDAYHDNNNVEDNKPIIEIILLQHYNINNTIISVLEPCSNGPCAAEIEINKQTKKGFYAERANQQTPSGTRTIKVATNDFSGDADYI